MATPPACSANLLASPQDPAMVCAYDFNRDGLLNGLDVAPFTAELMNPY